MNKSLGHFPSSDFTPISDDSLRFGTFNGNDELIDHYIHKEVGGKSENQERYLK